MASARVLTSPLTGSSALPQFLVLFLKHLQRLFRGELEARIHLLRHTLGRDHPARGVDELGTQGRVGRKPLKQVDGTYLKHRRDRDRRHKGEKPHMQQKALARVGFHAQEQPGEPLLLSLNQVQSLTFQIRLQLWKFDPTILR